MDEKKYAILAISESWLNSSVKNAEVEIDGYSLSRLDRPRNMKNEFGGGVCAYMRKTLKSKVLKDLSGISDTGFSPIMDASSAQNAQVIFAVRHLQASWL